MLPRAGAEAKSGAQHERRGAARGGHSRKAGIRPRQRSGIAC